MLLFAFFLFYFVYSFSFTPCAQKKMDSRANHTISMASVVSVTLRKPTGSKACALDSIRVTLEVIIEELIATLQSSTESGDRLIQSQTRGLTIIVNSLGAETGAGKPRSPPVPSPPHSLLKDSKDGSKVRMRPADGWRDWTTADRCGCGPPLRAWLLALVDMVETRAKAAFGMHAEAHYGPEPPADKTSAAHSLLADLFVQVVPLAFGDNVVSQLLGLLGDLAVGARDGHWCAPTQWWAVRVLMLWVVQHSSLLGLDVFEVCMRTLVGTLLTVPLPSDPLVASRCQALFLPLAIGLRVFFLWKENGPVEGSAAAKHKPKTKSRGYGRSGTASGLSGSVPSLISRKEAMRGTVQRLANKFVQKYFTVQLVVLELYRECGDLVTVSSEGALHRSQWLGQVCTWLVTLIKVYGTLETVCVVPGGTASPPDVDLVLPCTLPPHARLVMPTPTCCVDWTKAAVVTDLLIKAAHTLLLLAPLAPAWAPTVPWSSCGTMIVLSKLVCLGAPAVTRCAGRVPVRMPPRLLGKLEAMLRGDPVQQLAHVPHGMVHWPSGAPRSPAEVARLHRTAWLCTTYNFLGLLAQCTLLAPSVTINGLWAPETYEALGVVLHVMRGCPRSLAIIVAIVCPPSGERLRTQPLSRTTEAYMACVFAALAAVAHGPGSAADADADPCPVECPPDVRIMDTASSAPTFGAAFVGTAPSPVYVGTMWVQGYELARGRPPAAVPAGTREVVTWSLRALADLALHMAPLPAALGGVMVAHAMRVFSADSAVEIDPAELCCPGGGTGGIVRPMLRTVGVVLACTEGLSAACVYHHVLQGLVTLVGHLVVRRWECWEEAAVILWYLGGSQVMGLCEGFLHVPAPGCGTTPPSASSVPLSPQAVEAFFWATFLDMCPKNHQAVTHVTFERGVVFGTDVCGPRARARPGMPLASGAVTATAEPTDRVSRVRSRRLAVDCCIAFAQACPQAGYLLEVLLRVTPEVGRLQPLLPAVVGSMHCLARTACASEMVHGAAGVAPQLVSTVATQLRLLVRCAGAPGVDWVLLFQGFVLVSRCSTLWQACQEGIVDAAAVLQAACAADALQPTLVVGLVALFMELGVLEDAVRAHCEEGVKLNDAAGTTVAETAPLWAVVALGIEAIVSVCLSPQVRRVFFGAVLRGGGTDDDDSRWDLVHEGPEVVVGKADAGSAGSAGSAGPPVHAARFVQHALLPLLDLLVNASAGCWSERLITQVCMALAHPGTRAVFGPGALASARSILRCNPTAWHDLVSGSPQCRNVMALYAE